MEPHAAPVIAVFGSSQPVTGDAAYEDARRVGRALASAGWTVLTGGYGGVMEGASRGAKEAGGATIGITTAFFDRDRPGANSFVDREIKVPTYAERLLALIDMADGYVAMPGGSGTLSEVFVALELVRNGSLPRRPVVLYGPGWRRIFGHLSGELTAEHSFAEAAKLVGYADTPEDVVAMMAKYFDGLM